LDEKVAEEEDADDEVEVLNHSRDMRRQGDDQIEEESDDGIKGKTQHEDLEPRGLG